ncbi:MAG TPA: sigma-70 family RNA polymerase sigma factor [Steroidobacteraceae bacterium]|nr:sigma-70 family RNA polymerase sigma factor [Steroidobacteraceae bacterium]
MTRLAEIRVAEGILAGARGGDPGAQAQLYALVAPGVFALIRRIVGVRAVAEDVFQDTMIMVFEQLDRYRQEAPLGAWAAKIALSRSLMFLRSPWHRARLSFGSHADAEVLLPPASLSHAGPDVESFDVERALASLTPTARAVVWLYEVEGWSHEEIAQNFGKTVSFSKSQLARAHMRLRAWFEPEASHTCAPT